MFYRVTLKSGDNPKDQSVLVDRLYHPTEHDSGNVLIEVTEAGPVVVYCPKDFPAAMITEAIYIAEKLYGIDKTTLDAVTTGVAVCLSDKHSLAERFIIALNAFVPSYSLITHLAVSLYSIFTILLILVIFLLSTIFLLDHFWRLI